MRVPRATASERKGAIDTKNPAIDLPREAMDQQE
jgi:hypothetical protein